MGKALGQGMADAAEHWRELGLQDAAARGDANAWQVLFDSAYDRVTAYIRWRSGGQAELAEDAIQETWLLAARKVAGFDPAAGPFAAWVCGLAANVLRNLLRSRSRRASRFAALFEFAAAPTGDGESEEHIAHALAALPEHYEAALRMKYLDGKGVEAIAATTGQSAKAVESLLTRARQAFREYYCHDG